MATLRLKKPAPTLFWMVWRKGSGKTKHQHLTFEEANAEALRLATAFPDRTFYVLESKAVYGAPG